MSDSPGDSQISHRLRRMRGRDPGQEDRAATPLELLFDLTFVTSFAVAAAQLSHMLAAGHVTAALIAFAIATFSICWAWVNFTWFSSAFDTDDWLFRLLTMIQMSGVLILAIGLPRMFASVERGLVLDSGVLVAGYIVMRIALVLQWLRAARDAPNSRQIALTYAVIVTVAQAGWAAAIWAGLPLKTTLMLVAGLVVVELTAPIVAERRSDGTPWHVHHIVERYGLLAIIALGEGIAGTLAALTAVVDAQGWSTRS